MGDGTLEELRNNATAEERTRVSVMSKREDTERLLSGIEGTRKVDFVGEDDGFSTFVLHGKVGAELWREVGKLARLKNWELRELSDRPLSLEETFLKLTEKAEGSARTGA